jgi:hypothetical protein
MKSFRYCQSQIEDNGKCETQCEHCKEYYAPLENDAYTNYSIKNFGKTIHTKEQFIERIKTDESFAKKYSMDNEPKGAGVGGESLKENFIDSSSVELGKLDKIYEKLDRDFMYNWIREHSGK